MFDGRGVPFGGRRAARWLGAAGAIVAAQAVPLDAVAEDAPPVAKPCFATSEVKQPRDPFPGVLETADTVNVGWYPFVVRGAAEAGGTWLHAAVGPQGGAERILRLRNGWEVSVQSVPNGLPGGEACKFRGTCATGGASAPEWGDSPQLRFPVEVAIGGKVEQYVWAYAERSPHRRCLAYADDEGETTCAKWESTSDPSYVKRRAPTSVQGWVRLSDLAFVGLVRHTARRGPSCRDFEPLRIDPPDESGDTDPDDDALEASWNLWPSARPSPSRRCRPTPRQRQLCAWSGPDADLCEDLAARGTTTCNTVNPCGAAGSSCSHDAYSACGKAATQCAPGAVSFAVPFAPPGAAPGSPIARKLASIQKLVNRWNPFLAPAPPAPEKRTSVCRGGNESMLRIPSTFACDADPAGPFLRAGSCGAPPPSMRASYLFFAPRSATKSWLLRGDEVDVLGWKVVRVRHADTLARLQALPWKDAVAQLWGAGDLAAAAGALEVTGAVWLGVRVSKAKYEASAPTSAFGWVLGFSEWDAAVADPEMADEDPGSFFTPPAVQP